MHFDSLASIARMDMAGQSTVEYAVVFCGFLSVVAGLHALAHFFEDGVIIKHALLCASHAVAVASAAMIGDIFLY